MVSKVRTKLVATLNRTQKMQSQFVTQLLFYLKVVRMRIGTFNFYVSFQLSHAKGFSSKNLCDLLFVRSLELCLGKIN